jgi:hypothetical protein
MYRPWILLGMDLNAKMLCFNETFVSMSCMKVIQNAWWFFTLQFCCIRFEFLLNFIAILRTLTLYLKFNATFQYLFTVRNFHWEAKAKMCQPRKVWKIGVTRTRFSALLYWSGLFFLENNGCGYFSKSRINMTWRGRAGQIQFLGDCPQYTWLKISSNWKWLKVNWNAFAVNSIKRGGKST